MNDIGSSFHEGLYKEQVMLENYIKSTVCLFSLMTTTFKPNYIEERVIMLQVSTYSNIFMYDLVIFDLGLKERVMTCAVCFSVLV